MARGRRRRRGGAGDGWKIAAGAALALLAAAGFGAILWLNASIEAAPALVAETLCPVDGPRAVTVVLLDVSDDLPEPARRQVETRVLDIADALPTHGLLELRVLEPDRATGRVLFSRCNPGTGEGLSELTANPEAVQRAFQEGFRRPLGDLLANGLPANPAGTSPIMKAVQRIAIDHFEGRAAAGRDKTLVVVSDMLENTPDYSHYAGDLSFERFRASPAYPDVRTDLGGAGVTVLYVQRRAGARPFDSGEHIRFWERWVTDMNGHLTEAVKLQGTG
ncbi:hypothetical protein [Chthonobacter rhizosphaerae]|uniref:hypothetical protein n=1 Tax=Chthonobacter rhizosphaerae TaxID=2735553 RepID=UPI0015EEF7D3|nr:hypothetical protein [Chthonobacter rhizosphaerae]